MEAEAYMPVVLGEKTVECLLDSIQKKCSNFQPNTIGTIPSHFLAAKAYMAPWGGWGLRGCQSTSISPQLFTDQYHNLTNLSVNRNLEDYLLLNR